MRHRRTGLGLAIATLRGGSGRIDCDEHRCEGERRLEMETPGDASWTLRAWGLAIVSGPGSSSQTR
jgi:hypothetical protein